ncbi:hypothetical protein PIIN_05837 [Serendipita indica DSM 11827]|uniref:Methyltransferase domain-containing protein n=1 Tax=Serendipita indica (strain DSM 11827) TaxID=1109443 RepID=G4TKQ9_SERID|nr:hypothetical protein PIIN_05837 [Serendipita indica DSM 11827]
MMPAHESKFIRPDTHSSSSGSGEAKARSDQESYSPAMSQLTPTLDSGSVDNTSASITRVEEEDRMSRISMHTYSTGDVINQYRRQERGRAFNILNDTYFFPTDEDEWTRLNKQHIIIVIALGGLYPAANEVQAILAPEVGKTKRILDLGCGTGVWAVAMAREYPHCEVIGVDLAPTPVDLETLPPNCHFEIDDIMNGLEHFQGQFDVVHARVISGGLRNFEVAKRNIELCLKPGGMMIWIDIDFQMLTEDRNVYHQPASDEHPDGSWTTRIFAELQRGAFTVGRSDLAAAIRTIDRGLWSDDLIDPETCGAASFYIPAGPWASHPEPLQNQRLKFVGQLSKQDLKSAHRALQPILLRVGFTSDVLEEWVRQSDEELDKTTRHVLVRCPVAWGRRRAGHSEPAPPLPPLVTNEEEGIPPYPYIYYYTNEEEALKATELRAQNKANIYLPPPPNPL